MKIERKVVPTWAYSRRFRRLASRRCMVSSSKVLSSDSSMVCIMGMGSGTTTFGGEWNVFVSWDKALGVEFGPNGVPWYTCCCCSFKRPRSRPGTCGCWRSRVKWRRRSPAPEAYEGDDAVAIGSTKLGWGPWERELSWRLEADCPVWAVNGKTKGRELQPEGSEYDSISASVWAGASLRTCPWSGAVSWGSSRCVALAMSSKA